VSAALNVTSLYHDTILAKVARDDPRYKPLLPPSPLSRFTRAWAERVSPYKWAARMLEVINFTQLVIEMAMRRKVSAKNKWRGIVLLEFIKYVSVNGTLSAHP
jgi:peroxin-16